MRTLIIEDDPSVSRSVELVLKARGYRCAIAGSGAEGLALARGQDHDIILLDLSLPDMDGLEVLREMHAAHIRTPVLILSGSNDRQDKLTGLGIGADDYVTKPFDKDELLARIRAIIRRATGRTPPSKASILDGALLAKRSKAAPWSFTESYSASQPLAAKNSPVAAASPRTIIDLQSLPSSTEHRPAAERGLSPAPQLGSAKVIVLGNCKGGTGKSTIAMHLIAAYLAAGHKVGSIDCDQAQLTLTRYIANRRRFAKHKAPDLALPDHHASDVDDAANGKAGNVLAEQTMRDDVVIIDTPGHESRPALWALRQADVLITPINDSFVDLDVLAEFADDSSRISGPSRYSNFVAGVREDRRAMGQNMEWIVLRNRLGHIDAQNRRSMASALSQLSGSLMFQEGPGLRERVVYRELFLSGLTLLDLPRKDTHLALSMSHVAARQELRGLVNAVQAALAPQDLGTTRPNLAPSRTGSAAQR